MFGLPRGFIFYVLTVFIGLFAFLAYGFLLMMPDVRISMSLEAGFIEGVTAASFGLLAVLAFVRATEKRSELAWLFVFFMVLACARELDLHKAFTEDSVLKLNFYFKSDAPLLEKIGGGFFVLLLVYGGVRLLTYAPQWARDVWALKADALAIFLAMGVLGTAKTLDAFARLFPFLTDFYQENRSFFSLTEESFELASVFLFGYVCFSYFKSRLQKI